MLSPRFALVVLLTLTSLGTVAEAAPAPEDSITLWQLGKTDQDDREFALAPDGYIRFRHDGFFVVGQSSVAKNWPYVHPGPVDAWAGGRRHTFTIVFGLKVAPVAGSCVLKVALVDTQGQSPPKLGIRVNDTTSDRTAGTIRPRRHASP